MEITNVKKEHEKYISWFWTIIAFLFPVSEYMFYNMWDKDYEKTTKKTKLSSIIGACTQVLLIIILSCLLSFSSSFLLGTLTTRSFLFYVSLFYSLESASGLIFAHVLYVNNPMKTENKIYKLFRYLFIALTTIFGVLAVYEMDAVIIDIPKGIPFDSQSPTIAFYAIFILFGAAMSYLIASNKIHKLGGPRDMLEVVFYIAFPLGIVGARAWWVISEWNRSLAGSHTFWDIINIRNGGLAIQGGVLFGAWVGVWHLIEKRRSISIFKLTDAIVPGILIAQAIGRLGNFTNVEVYGQVANASDWWFLPNVIVNQYMNSLGHFVVPLFLIEGLMNVLGYFVLTYIVGGLLKKWIEDGDISFGYLVWYGTVRMIMEPMRDEQFIMGTSVQMSIAFIVAGVLCIIINHLVRYLVRNNQTKVQGFNLWCQKVSQKMDEHSYYVKIIGCLPIINGFYYGFYRFIKGHYYTGVSWLIFGSVIGWIIDLYSVLTKKPLVMCVAYE